MAAPEDLIKGKVAEFSIDDAQKILAALVTRPDQALPGLEELGLIDRLRLLGTCASKMIVFSLCSRADNDAATALRELDVLVEDMRKEILKQCGVQ